MLHEMKVSGIAIDPFTNTPIIILKDLKGDKMLPIWIGFMEANSIAMELEKTPRSRPLTHDLLKNILDDLKYSVSRVELTDLKDNTYYAAIHLKKMDDIHIFDSRPSDAIAIAIRTSSKIFVHDCVLQSSKQIQAIDEDKEKLAEMLDKIPPGNFGKYKM